MSQIKAIIIGLSLAAIMSGAFALGKKTFVWSDINTREVIRWDGDSAVVRQGSSMQELTCNITIDQSKVTEAIESFGIPKTWTTFMYTDERDLAKQQKELKAKAANYGIKMLEESNRFTIDYNWVINQNKSSIEEIAKRIRSTARRRGYRSRRELVGAFASFVQSLKYRVPRDYRLNGKNEKILTAGAMMPLETLAIGWGDCDSKSMLFAALVQSIDLVDVCFIVMDEHLFAAVQLSPKAEDHSVRYKGEDWILIELTDAWPIGRVPEKHLHNIKNRRYTIVDLN